MNEDNEKVEDTVETPEGNTVYKSVEDVLKDEKLKPLVYSIVDSKVTKALETQRSKLEASLNERAEELIKQRATKTPEQIKLDELNAKIANMEKQVADKELNEMRLTNKSKATKMLNEANLPIDLVDFIVSADAEETDANAAKVIEVLTGFTTEIKQGVLKNNNTQLPGKTKMSGGLKEPGPNASKEEWKAYVKEMNLHRQ